MFLFFTLNDPLSNVERAQQDEEYLNEFIKENKKFIMVNTFKTMRHFVTESDDEWSVTLMAFHEAIRSYDVSKGKFKSFAALVIKRRLTDYIISQSRHQSEIFLEPETMDGNLDDEENATPIQLELRTKSAELSMQQENTDIRDEIDAMQRILEIYGFTFFDLTECSPKAEKTKNMCAKAVVVLLTHPELLRKMRGSGSLPIKEILKQTDVPKKVLERHRKYIIATAEIMNGDYTLLKEYMEYIRKALKEYESSCS